MAVVSVCPDVHVLQQLALGQVSLEEVERLARHVEACGACVGVLHTLRGDDTLTDSIKAASAVEEVDPRIREVIARLTGKQQPSPESTDVFRGAPREPGIESVAPADFLAPAQAADEIGRLGPYRVLKVLGAGGMGMVFQAEDPQLRRLIALKTMLPAVAANPRLRQRFLREGQAAALLESDYIVPIHQVGEDRGVPYLAMPFLKGTSLEERLKKSGPLNLKQAVRLALQTARGLAVAHEAGLVHRDIKPANLWIEPEGGGRVKILDFGLARGAEDDSSLTQSGTIVGTPSYMAPEQARGEKVDGRCDLFSLGCVLYRAITGRLPFKGENSMSVLLALVQDTPQPLHELKPEVPRQLSDLVVRLLAKDATKRPANARAVIDTLTSVERTLLDAPATAVPAAGGSRPTKRRGWLVACAAAGVAALIVAGIIIIVRNKEGKEIARYEEKDGKSVEVIPTDDKKDPPKDGKPIDPVKINAEPLPPLKGGEPLNSMSLVGRPEKIKGVRSWTIETRMHRGGVGSVAYSPNGQWLATGGLDGIIRVWDAATNALVRVLVGHEGAIYQALSWAPDSKTLASGSVDKTVRLWDVNSGKLLRVIQEPTGEVRAVAWSPDGKLLAWGSVSVPGTIRLWSAEKAEIVRSLQEDSSQIKALAWSPDGKTLGIGSLGGMVRLWNVETGKPGHAFNAASVNGLAWHRDGKILASSGAARTIKLWDTQTGKAIQEVRPMIDERSVVYGLAWSPNGETLASGSGDSGGALELWNLASGKTTRVNNAGQNVYGVSWSIDGKTITGSSDKGEVVMYEAATGDQISKLSGRGFDATAYDVSWPGNEKWLTFRGLYSGSTLWDLSGASLLRRTEGKWLLSPDANLIASHPTNAEKIEILDAASKNPQWEISLKNRSPGSPVAWSPGSNLLVTGHDDDKTLRMWDAKTGKPTGVLQLNASGTIYYTPAWSQDGKRFAVFEGGGLGLWDVAAGKRLGIVKVEMHLSTSQPVWSRDGKTVGLGYKDGSIQFWDVETQQRLEPFTGHRGEVDALGWLPDGKTLASYSQDRTIRLWNTQTGQWIKTIPVGCATYAATFSPDRRLLALNELCMARLFETATGTPRGVLIPLTTESHLAISPEGHYKGSPRIDRQLVYVAQLDDGSQVTLPPEEFTKRFGWKNDPEKVRFTGKSSD